ncbi:MAG: M48 family metalloprotease [Candidatus Eremiobacteraeota bacterium]|nr:M48 family metalloprotease [Candidatus Eremiobacteraeota bacterium]
MLLAVIINVTAGTARAQTAIDRHVSAIPAAQLLSESPAQLVDPSRQQAAQYFARYTRPAWFVWIGLQILLLLYLWSSGKAARVRDWLRRRLPNIVFVRFFFGGFLALAVQVAALPAAFFDYRILRIMGISTQSPGSWWSDVVLGAGLEMVLLGIAVVIILWLVDRTRLWWLWTVGGIFAAAFFLSFIYPVAVEPIFNHFTPLPANRLLTARIHELAAKAGAGGLPIYISDLSRRTKAGNAYVVGIGPSKRIVVGDTLLTGSTDGEIVFIVAHELGHDVHHDTIRGSIFGAIIFILGAALAVLIADRVGFRRDDDPLSRLTLVASLLACMYLLFLPVINGYSRILESSADQYALQLDPDRVSGTRAFVRFADEGVTLLCPGRLARMYWYTHPPIGTRISSVNGSPNPCP